MSGNQPKRKSRPGADRMGRTPLHYAALDGDEGLVRQLVASGMDVNAPDDSGRTPLHFAAQSNAVTVTAVLLKAGASVDARDSHGNTPLSAAVFNSRGNGEVIKILRAYGADPYGKNDHGVSPLSLSRTIAKFDVRQFFRDLPE
jgi:ankyrin repeat protein